MFLSFLGITFFSVYSLITLPKSLKIIALKNKNPQNSQEELSQNNLALKRAKFYTRKIFLLLLTHVVASIISGITCLLDGLSDTVNGLVLPTWVFLSCALVLVVFFSAYTQVMAKKYKMRTLPSNSPSNWRTNAPVDLCAGILIAFVYALNCAFVAYTIQLLII